MHYSLLPILLILFSPLQVFSHTIGADFDGDGSVGFSDFVLFAQGYGTTQERFDLTQDGKVDFDDFVAFVTDYGKVTHEEGETEVGGSKSTFVMIHDHVFNESCISSSCHSTEGAAGGLSLEPGVAYLNLVGRGPQNTKAKEEGLQLVVPGDAERSFLLKKLTGSGAGYGEAMPRGFWSLNGIAIDAISQWIVAGAPEEGIVERAPDLDELPHSEFSFEPPAPPERGVQIHLKPFAIAPGKEREIFSTTTLGTSEDLMVNKIEVAQPEGSHHFIIYQLKEGEVPPEGIRDLDPTNLLQAIGIFGRQFIVGSQSPFAVLDFPEGVVIPMPANVVYELNSHFVNVSGENTLIGEVYINLHTIPQEEVEHVAKPIFISNFGFEIAPGATVTTGMDWTLREDVKVVMLSSHMHRHGKQFEILKGGVSIYQSLDWADPKTLYYNPPLSVKSGELVRFECTHENDDKDFTIRFGFTAENDEMCILLGYYY